MKNFRLKAYRKRRKNLRFNHTYSKIKDIPKESYIEQVERVKKSNLLTHGDIFDFTVSNEYVVYDYVYTFFKESIEYNKDKYGIENPVLIFTNDYQLNGFAYESADFQIIEITRGIVSKYFELYTNGATVLEKYKDCFKCFNEVGIPLFQMLHIDSLTFLVHHELAHLQQKVGGYSEFSRSDGNAKSEKEILEWHALEFDADIFGSTTLVLYLLKRFDNKKTISRSYADLLSSILTAGIVSIIVTFSFFNARGTNLYYVERKHPHPLIRFDYVLMNIIRLLETNVTKLPPIDLRKIVQNSILIANELVARSNRENDTQFFQFELAELAKVYDSESVKEYKEKLTSMAVSLPRTTINNFLSKAKRLI